MRYPGFSDDRRSSAYILLENFCIRYIDTLMQELMHMHIPAQLQHEQGELVRLQKRLLTNENHIRELAEFQVKARLSNLSFAPQNQPIQDLPTEEFSIQINNRDMLPVLESMMEIHQQSEDAYAEVLRKIEQHLASIANKKDQAYVDNPFSPFSLCNIFYSSVAPVDLTTAELLSLLRLYKLLLSRQLLDFYIQIESNIESLGRKDKLKKAVDYSKRKLL